MSENVLLNNNSFLYELNQKNDQIEYLTNENNQYSQLVYNLQNEIFSLKSKLTNFNNISLQLKLSQEKNIELENTIQKLSNEILDITHKNKENARKNKMKYYSELKKLKFENDGYKNKIEMVNHLSNEKEGLMNALDKIVKDKNEILSEKERIIRENKINSELKLSNIKKKLFDTVNESQEKIHELNSKYMDNKTKLTYLQYQQIMVKYQYLNKLYNELVETNKILKKQNFELKRELEIHKEVELSLAEKYKKIRGDKDYENINLTSYNNSFRKTEKDLSDEKNKTILNMQKKIYRLKNVLELKQNDLEEEKMKNDTIQKSIIENEKKYFGIFNYLDECLKLFFNDDYLKSKKKIYIRIESLKKGDFSQLSKEEKYATLSILMKYLMPLIYNNNYNLSHNQNDKFQIINSKNNIKYFLGNNLERKKSTNFFKKILKKKIFKKNESNLELPFNFSYNSLDNSFSPSEKLSFISTKKSKINNI